MTKPTDPLKPLPAQPPSPAAGPPIPRVAATKEELVETLSYALRFNGQRAFPQASTLMARVTAEHLATQLERAGYELTRRPAPAQGPGPASATGQAHVRCHPKSHGS